MYILYNHKCLSGINIAFGKPAIQKTMAWDGVASRAVDGNTNANYNKGKSCTHTEAIFSPHSTWWAVDLEQQYLVESVRITNRDANGKYECISEFIYFRLHDDHFIISW